MTIDKNTTDVWIVIGYLTGVIFIIAGLFFTYNAISAGEDLALSINSGFPPIIAGVVLILVINIAKKKSEIEKYKKKIRECGEKIKKYENKI